MIWVKFPSIGSFNAWHDVIKQELGLPKPSTDFDGKVIDEAQWTVSYVEPIIIAADDIRALIDQVYVKDLQKSINPISSNYGQA